jgi:hypothetical protein
VAKGTEIMKWHSMDEIKATALTADTKYPSMVYQFPLRDLPASIPNMPGLVSAYMSHYPSTQPAVGGVSALGEFVAVRTDAGMVKGYNYIFGVSSDNKTYFAGPFKDIPGHHLQSSQPVPVTSLFVGQPKRGNR